MDYNIKEEAERLCRILGIDHHLDIDLVKNSLERAFTCGEIKQIHKTQKQLELVTGGK